MNDGLNNRSSRFPTLINKDIKIIISFDGGGTRGIIPAVIAEALEQESGVPLSQSCDLLIGTSRGGITTLLLTIPEEKNQEKPKFTASSIINIYRGFSERVFSMPFSRAVRTLWWYDKCKYSNHKIKEILEEHFQKTLYPKPLHGSSWLELKSKDIFLSYSRVMQNRIST